MEEAQYIHAVERFSNTVYHAAYQYCGNTSDTEDITQNTFLKLLLTDKPFEDEEYLRRWLIRVAVNEAKNLNISFWKRKITAMEQSQEKAIEPKLPEENQTLLNALLRLSPKCRIVIYLYYYEEYSTKEIAQILNIKETTVQTRLMRARKKLKEDIKMMNRVLYKETLDCVTLPGEAVYRIKNLRTPSRKTRLLYKTACGFAISLLLFFSGNIISCAMTGESLIDNTEAFYVFLKKPPIQTKDIAVNGNIEKESSLSPLKIIRNYVNENGLHCYVVNTGNHLVEYTARIEGDPTHTSVIIYHQKSQDGSSAGLALYEGLLVSQDNRILLTIINDDISIDITDDFVDGIASGTFKDCFDNIYTETLEYTITGNLNDYTVDIRWKENAE